MTDKESVRKNSTTGEYVDLCGECYQVHKETLCTLEDVGYGTEGRQGAKGFNE